MISINITQFFTYTNPQLYVFLLKENQSNWRIIIPRSDYEEEPDQLQVMIDFLNAAYAGQLLAEAAANFGYYVPGPATTNSFSFELTITDTENFTDVLHDIIQAYDYDGHEERFIDYQVEASQFMNYTYDEDYECHTWGLLHIANKLLANLG